MYVQRRESSIKRMESTTRGKKRMLSDRSPGDGNGMDHGEREGKAKKTLLVGMARTLGTGKNRRPEEDIAQAGGERQRPPSHVPYNPRRVAPRCHRAITTLPVVVAWVGLACAGRAGLASPEGGLASAFCGLQGWPGPATGCSQCSAHPCRPMETPHFIVLFPL